MKISFFRIAIVSLLCLFVHQLNAQRNCGTMELLQNKFKLHPALKVSFEKHEQNFQRLVEQRRKLASSERVLATPVIVPVIFHIVMQNPSVVTEAQVLAQLDTINKDYAGLNGDSVRIPAYFKSLFGKSGISFCLAQRTPTGEPTKASTGLHPPKQLFQIPITNR